MRSLPFEPRANAPIESWMKEQKAVEALLGAAESISKSEVFRARLDVS